MGQCLDGADERFDLLADAALGQQLNLLVGKVYGGFNVDAQLQDIGIQLVDKKGEFPSQGAHRAAGGLG